MITPLLGKKAVNDELLLNFTDVTKKLLHAIMLQQVLSVANRNGLKSRAIRGMTNSEDVPPACCSISNENAVKDVAVVGTAAEDELPFPVSLDVACSVLLVPLQRVCMQPACRIIAQARIICL